MIILPKKDTILFSGVCTLFLTVSAIVPSRGSTFFSQDVYYIAHKRLPLSSLNDTILLMRGYHF